MSTHKRYPVVLLERISVNSLKVCGKTSLSIRESANFSEVVIKQEFPSNGLTNKNVNNNTEINRTVVKEETINLFPAPENNSFDVRGSSTVEPDLNHSVKIECDITHNLVGFFPPKSEFERDKSPSEVKVEKIFDQSHGNVGTKKIFDSDVSPASVNVNSITSPACEKTINKPRARSRTHNNSSNVNLSNVFVLLEDIFPNKSRKLGKSHSNGGSCRCLYCRGEFRYSDHLLNDKQNEQSPQKAHSKVHLLLHRNEKSFKCEQCPAKFTRRWTLENHLSVHSGKRPFECKQCPAKFALRSILKSHLQVHDNKRPFKCEQCTDRFKRNDHLKVHMRRHTGEKPYKCKHCPAEFSQRSALTVHSMYKHSRERRFTCEQCSAKFKSKSEVRLHLRVHNGEKPFKCKQCPARFTQNSNLNTHVKSVHLGEKLYECKQCLYKCNSNQHLNVHIDSVHSGKRPFQCNKCSAKFKSKQYLKIHLRMHNGEKPYRCKLCPSKFRQSTHLKTHLKLIHSSERPFECSQCSAKLKTKQCLKSHWKVHSRENSLSESIRLKEHNSSETFNCKQCPAKFKKNGDLKSHRNRVHNPSSRDS